MNRVWDLKQEIEQFLDMKSKQNDFPQFKQTDWLSDFAFMVDLFVHMNEVNTKLLGKHTFAHELYFVVKAFRRKLQLFSRHLNENNFTHFAKLQTTKPSVIAMQK